ncbi:MAG: hypothetical protein IPJ71_17830 [Bdellovibrionales bacterium]|nr:hypothetical protein [Bdellovibrionales bacterium]
MKKLILVAALLGVVPLSSFAEETKGIEGLRRYNCNIVSETGEIEAVLPVEKTVLAESQNQATALYLLHIEANAVSRLVSVPYMTAGTTVTKYASLREVSCELIK